MSKKRRYYLKVTEMTVSGIALSGPCVQPFPGWTGNGQELGGCFKPRAPRSSDLSSLPSEIGRDEKGIATGGAIEVAGSLAEQIAELCLVERRETGI
jgi:hypothetical protein